MLFALVPAVFPLPARESLPIQRRRQRKVWYEVTTGWRDLVCVPPCLSSQNIARAAKSSTPELPNVAKCCMFHSTTLRHPSLVRCAHCERCERHPARRAERGQAHDDRSAHGGGYLLQQVLANRRMEICEPCPRHCQPFVPSLFFALFCTLCCVGAVSVAHYSFCLFIQLVLLLLLLISPSSRASIRRKRRSKRARSIKRGNSSLRGAHRLVCILLVSLPTWLVVESSLQTLSHIKLPIA